MKSHLKADQKKWNWEAKPHKLSLQSLHLQYGIHDGTFVQCTTCTVSRISHQVPSSKLRKENGEKTILRFFILRNWWSKVRIGHLISLNTMVPVKSPTFNLSLNLPHPGHHAIMAEPVWAPWYQSFPFRPMHLCPATFGNWGVLPYTYRGYNHL